MQKKHTNSKRVRITLANQFKAALADALKTHAETSRWNAALAHNLFGRFLASRDELRRAVWLFGVGVEVRTKVQFRDGSAMNLAEAVPVQLLRTAQGEIDRRNARSSSAPWLPRGHQQRLGLAS